jgi:hypothetical protein
MSKKLMWFNVLGLVFISFMLTSFLEPVESADSGKVRHPAVGPVELKASYSFAGEEVPLDNFDVRERLDRELNVNTYWQSSTILNIKNAAKFFPVIEPILREYGIPEDFKYLAVAESALRNATSSSGAKGFWQFLKPAAREMGLEVNSDIDERHNLRLSTEAACKYLKQNHKRFGSWTLAAAAYNTGPTRLSRELEMQKESNYYDLNLSEETMRYVFRIIALKEIMTDPERFGFNIDVTDLYEPLDNYYQLMVDYQIDNLADFAHEHGITYRMLKVYNPWMLTGRLPNKSRKQYNIHIPKKK